MYRFSTRSKTNLVTCHKKLQDLFNEVIHSFDCTIVEGHRNQARQEEMFRTGRSKARWGESKHNTLLATAVDVVPYLHGIDWRGEPELRRAISEGKSEKEILHNIERWIYFAGFVMGTAKMMNIPIRWGGDWDQDTDLADQTFDDWPHFELTSD